MANSGICSQTCLALLSHRHSESADTYEMDLLWIHTILLRVTFAFCNRDIHSNETGLLLVGGAKTGISQSVEFWIPDRARSTNNPPRLASTSRENSFKEQSKSIRCPTVPRGMWGHTTDSLPYGQGGTKCKAIILAKLSLLNQS